MTYTDELQAYCKRHNLEVVEEYTTWGEAGTYYRAKVKTSTGEVHTLYYDRSRRRRHHDKEKADLDIYLESGAWPPSPARGWRNVTLDNRKRTERQERRREENRRIRQQEAEPGCNGLCNPDLCRYEATCSIHGAKAILGALSGGEDVRA